MTRRTTRKTKSTFWSSKTTGELMVLMITFTVCFGVFASGVLVAVISILHPDKDISIWVSRITGLLNTMVGLLAGFLAGRTDFKSQAPKDGP